MGGEEAKRLYEHFFSKVQAGYAADKVKNGVFQAMMKVALVNDGPVGAPLVPSTTLSQLTVPQTGDAGAIRRAKTG
jgi:hypothetical protein